MENTIIADKPLTARQAKDAERAEAIESLKKSLKRGDTVYTILRSVGPSGMCRYMDVYALKNNKPHLLTWSTATALGITFHHKKKTLRVLGCGMDMGLHIASNLAMTLFDDGCALNHRWL